MSPHDLVPGVAETPERGAAEGTVVPLLDATVGLLVWMLHLLVVYVAVALSCGLGLVRARGQGTEGLMTVLIVVTLVAASVVGLHALRRWRRRREQPTRRFQLSLTIGCDAIAVVAILWQLFAIGVIPPCT